MKQTQLRGVLLLFLTAVIWGSAFVAQSMGMESLQPFTFNGVRMLIGTAAVCCGWPLGKMGNGK